MFGHAPKFGQACKVQLLGILIPQRLFIKLCTASSRVWYGARWLKPRMLISALQRSPKHPEFIQKSLWLAACSFVVQSDEAGGEFGSAAKFALNPKIAILVTAQGASLADAKSQFGLTLICSKCCRKQQACHGT